MLTPLDIQNKKFSNAPFGYKKSEVDDFFALVLQEYEKLYKASLEFNEKINAMTKIVDNYKGMEDTMKNTLVVAQTTAEQVAKNARKQSELIVNEANQKANEIISKANNKVISLTKELENLKHSMELFRIQSKAALETQIKALEISIED